MCRTDGRSILEIMSSLQLSDPKVRIHALDALRGFALCGILIINIYQTMHMRDLPAALAWFVQGRFFVIFSLLFGVGFGMFLERAAPRVPRPRVPLARRLIVLGVLGVLHGLLQPGEVLRFYAFFGLVVLLPFSYASRAFNVAAGLVLLVAGIFVIGGPALIPGLFVIGLVLSAYNVPRLLSGNASLLVALTAVFTVLSLIVAWLVHPAGGGLDIRVMETVLSLLMSFAYMTGLLLLLQTPLHRPLVAALAPLGRTALTNYLAATVLFVPLGHALRLEGSTAWGAAAGLAIGILAVQMVVSRWWLRRCRYGPLEWAWRCATWAQWVSIRRPAAVPAGGG
jgi:uncharacterized protein